MKPGLTVSERAFIIIVARASPVCESPLDRTHLWPDKVRFRAPFSAPRRILHWGVQWTTSELTVAEPS